MLKEEWKKIFLKRYYLFVLVAIMIAEGALCVLQSSNLFQSHSDKEIYELYVNTFCGPLTEKKKTTIDLILACFNDDTLLSEMTLPQESRNAIEKLLSASVKGRLGVERFREDYEYATAKHGRSVIHTTAWEFLFGTERIDFFCVLAVILFTILSFVAENETDITSIKYTTPQGKTKLYRIDLFTGILISMLLSVIASLMRLCVALVRFSFHNFAAPAESLSLFENTPYSFSLLGSYLVITGIKALGTAAFLAFCFLLGNLLASSVAVVMGSLLAVLLPQYVLSAPISYYLPPVSLMLGNGFFFGNVTIEIENALPLAVSSATGKAALPVSFLGAAALFISAFYVVRKRREHL